MKKILVAGTAVLLASRPVFGQGTITFNNLTTAGDAPIFADAFRGAGEIPNMVAELDLIVFTPGTPGIITYTPLATTTFRGTSGTLAQFINPVDVTVPNVPAGSPANFVVRVYNGPNYQTSSGPGLYHGQSNLVTVQQLGGLPPTGAPPIPTPDLSGLNGFYLVQEEEPSTPEPSTLSLLLLGAALLLYPALRPRGPSFGIAQKKQKAS